MQQVQLNEEQIAQLARANAFYNVGDADKNEQIAANTRAFRGDGTPFLAVPGLLKLESVRTDRLQFPQEVINKIPLDVSFTNFHVDRQPCVVRSVGKEGVPVLLRHRQSNDGIWQDGEAFFVTGEWDPKVAERPLPPKAKKD